MGAIRVTLELAEDPFGRSPVTAAELRRAAAWRRPRRDPDPLRKYRPVRDPLAADPLGPWARFGRPAPKARAAKKAPALGVWRPVFDPLAVSQTPVRGWTAAGAAARDLEQAA